VKTMKAQAALAVLLAVVAAGCSSGDEDPGQAIFHPRGVEALHPSEAAAGELLVGGKVYVPVYSNIYSGGPTATTELSATVSIRNADAERPLVLVAVTYYDSLGNRIEDYLDEVVELDPMATVEFVIERPDTRGGSGANFIVEWGSTTPIAEPVMEAVMLGRFGGVGLSFVSQGRPIRMVGPSRLEP